MGLGHWSPGHLQEWAWNSRGSWLRRVSTLSLWLVAKIGCAIWQGGWRRTLALTLESQPLIFLGTISCHQSNKQYKG
jgi:hypothetical protein